MKTFNNPKKLLTYLAIAIVVALAFIIAIPFSVAKIPEGYFRVRKANKQYDKEQYTDAEVLYRRTIDKNQQNYAAHYDLGNSLFKQEKAEDAENAYLQARKYLPT